MAENGSSPSILGQKRVGRNMKAANAQFGLVHVIGQHHLPPVSGRTPTGTSRFSLLLVSSHPVLATFCCILLVFTSLIDLTSLVQEYPAQMTWGPVENGREVMWALAASEFRLLQPKR